MGVLACEGYQLEKENGYVAPKEYKIFLGHFGPLLFP